MTDPAAPPAPRPKRWVKWLLIASLALNLLLIGAGVGGVLRAWRMAGDAGQQPQAELMLLWRALPDADRRALRDLDVAGRPDRGQVRARIAADIAAVQALLVAEPFDRAALEARLIAVRARSSERADLVLARMLDRISAMPAADRAALADRLDRRARRWRD